MAVDLKKIFKFVDDNKAGFIKRLGEYVSVPSVSAEPGRRNDTIQAVHWMKARLEPLGVKVRLEDVGKQKLIDGLEIPLPPILLGELGNDPAKRTVCIYGHLDVQPAAKEDGWDSEPFVLTEKNGKMYGRGSSDDKGPVLGWVNVIEAYQKTGQTIPINMKFCFEAMEESGSEGLEELVRKEEKKFFKDVDFYCISDNYWLSTTKPCITYGLRGIAYFTIEVSGPKKDLHSGVFGGSVHEPMQDIVALMASLTTHDGKIAVAGIYDDVRPVTDAERKLYEPIEFDISSYAANDCQVKQLRHDNKADVLMSRWRHPNLSVHDISGGSIKTIVSANLTARFSIRLVPDMDPKKVEKQVTEHLQNVMKQRKSPNSLRIVMGHGVPAWMADPQHPHFEAGKKATKTVYGVEPDMTREGGSIPVTLTFSELNGGSNVMLLPMGASDDGAHSQNEKLDVRNFIEGTKLMAAYVAEVAQIPSDKKR